jgi:Fe-S-cluster-containing dehydrogenase component
VTSSIATRPTGEPQWGKVVDHTRCIGCHACTTACKSENAVPLSVTRTYVKYVDAGHFPQARRSFQVTRCNQCADAPCVTACPTAAMFARPDSLCGEVQPLRTPTGYGTGAGVFGGMSYRSDPGW